MQNIHVAKDLFGKISLLLMQSGEKAAEWR